MAAESRVCLIFTGKTTKIIVDCDYIISFEHDLIKDMVHKMAQQGPPYYSAIQKSAVSASKGTFFAKDAVDFCDRLISAEDSIENLTAALGVIMQVARTAHEDSKEMNRQFKNIRTELFEVCFLHPVLIGLEPFHLRSSNASPPT
jgi:hypothetical protein